VLMSGSHRLLIIHSPNNGFYIFKWLIDIMRIVFVKCENYMKFKVYYKVSLENSPTHFFFFGLLCNDYFDAATKDMSIYDKDCLV
jgi:hypothetical protein